MNGVNWGACRAAELRRLSQLRHFELLAELSPHITDPWHEAQFAGMSRDGLITRLLEELKRRQEAPE